MDGPVERPVDHPGDVRSDRPWGRPGGRWGDLSRRVLSGAVLLAVSVGCVWVGGILFPLLVALGCVVLASEWVTMCGYARTGRSGFWMPIIVVAAALASGLGTAGGGLTVVLLGTVAVAMLPGGNRRVSLAFGVPYIGLAAVALPWLRADPVRGLANTLFVLAIVWASDIGAYLVGRLVGGPKLAPSISPGKTWSGAGGGLLGAVAAGLAIAPCFSTGYSPLHVIGLAIALGIISQAGDLLESALKRRFGVKDSGRIIPGHGGLLDRVDALLVVAPAAALLALTVGRGVVLWR